MAMPEDNLTTGHQNQHVNERKENKKHKKKKHKRHKINGTDVMLEAAEITEQELSVDQELEMERKKKHRAENCGVSTEVKGKEKKSKRIEHREEVNGLETFEEEHILKEGKKTKSSCDQSETPQKVLQVTKKNKKTEKESRAQFELSIQCLSGTEAYQQEEEPPKKRKKNRQYDQTELSIPGVEDGTESSQLEVKVPEQTPKEIIQESKRRRKKRESRCGQTESDVLAEREDDSGISKQRENLPEQNPLGILQKKKKRRRESNNGQTGLSNQSAIMDGNESSQHDEELPLVKKKKKKRSMINGESDLSESRIQAGTVTGKKDGEKASKQGGVPLARTRAKKNKGKTSSDQKERNVGMEDSEIETEIEDNLAENTLDIELKEGDWEHEKMKYIDELKEFIPNIEKKSIHTLIHLMKYDLQRFKEFKKAGVSMRHGRYSTEEVRILKKNVEDFLALTGIDCGTKLFFPSRFPEEFSHITKTKRQYMFHLRISAGICRPWHDIYSKGRKLFDSFKMGRFTEDEVNSLQKLHTLHGSNWMKIAELTGRSNLALEKHYSQMSVNKGYWTEGELQSLEGALRDHLVTLAEPGANGPTITRNQLYCKLPWTKVAQKVGTRSWSKCRLKWMAILKKRMTEATEGNPDCDTCANTVRLIKTLHALEIEDAADINWEDLTKVFGDVTPHYVQTKFHRLKTKWVPRWQVLSFGEIIDFLYEKALPQLEENLVNPEREIEDVGSQQESFLLSKIFSDI